MFNNDKDIGLSDLIDVDYLQGLQDEFAELMSVAVITVDKNGPITKPTNFSDFCANQIRGTKLGLQKCIDSELSGQDLAIEKGEPVIYTCHAGLTRFVIPIMLKGEYIASIIAGQISTKEIDEEHFKNIAKELGITNEDEYLKSLRKIKVMPQENVEIVVRLLSTFVNTICVIAYKNYELIKKKQREELTEKIIKKLREVFDSDEIKQYFVDITQQYFDADRCVFSDFDLTTNKFLPFKYEKLKSDDLQSLLNADLEEQFPEFCEKTKKGKDIIIKDAQKLLSRKFSSENIILKRLNTLDIKSDYGLLVKCQNKIVGVLIMHFINEKKVLSSDEINFLKTIREHAGTGICQSKLYEKLKLQVKRENLIRQITEAIRKSLDFEKTKCTIVESIGKALDVDRCFITEYNKTTDKFLTVNEEYLSSDSLKSFKGLDLNERYYFINEELKKGKILIMHENGVQVGDDRFNLYEANYPIEKEDHDLYNINSFLIFPLFYREEFLGNLVLHSTKTQRKIGEDEIEFLNLISNQIALAMHQAKMYKKIQMQAEREKISRNIIEIMRGTLDKNIITKLFVKNIGKFFDADRVFMCNFDEKTKIFNPIDEYSEFLSNNELKSFVGIDLMRATSAEYTQKLLEKRELIIPSVNDYMKNNNLTKNEINLFELGDLKSIYCFPVTYQDKLTGTLNIMFVTKQVDLSNEDINRIRSICTQAGIALYHADLYMQAQEALLDKNNIINKVKNGVEPAVNIIVKDMDNVLKSCHELLELTKDISKEQQH